MNEDFAELEIELLSLRPLRPSSALEARLAEVLRELPAEDRPPAAPWWQLLGFHRPLAAFAWGLATPAAAVCAVFLSHVAGVADSGSGSAVSTAHPVGARSLTAATAASNPGFEPAATSDVVYQTDDEGVVYTSDRQPVHQVRTRAQETLAWHNPKTGAQVEVSYPREEVVLTPIALR